MALTYDGTKQSLARRLRVLFGSADQHVDDRISELLGHLMAISTAEVRPRSSDHPHSS